MVLSIGVPILAGVLLLRLVLLPLRLGGKLLLHGGGGFVCLWLLNSVSAFTGIHIPVNPVTVLTAGFLGLPGIGVMALLELMR